MPQKDRHRIRKIPIEFSFYDTLENLPVEKRLSIILITNGTLTLKLNQNLINLNAPALICLSPYDTFEVVTYNNLSVKVFHFDPWYIKACLKFDNLNLETDVEPAYEHQKIMLYYLFLEKSSTYNGTFELSPANYLHINENMSLIGAETFSQSDSYWTCRIRRLLVATLNCINDLYSDQRKLKFFEQQDTNYIMKCMDYIHTHYQQDVSLNDLCKIANINRTSLNDSFKSVVGCTIIDYLNNYRIQISCELLSHTDMSLENISNTCGFTYVTYFVKQFKKKMGKTPTQFRNELKEILKDTKGQV